MSDGIATALNATGSQVQQTDVGGIDVLSLLVVIIPLILFLLALNWGLQKKTRKQRVIEVSYNLIALELLALVVLPVCSLPSGCAGFVFVPVLMFGLLIWFVYHRTRRDAMHEVMVLAALEGGHIRKEDVVRGKVEEEAAHKLAEDAKRLAAERKRDEKAKQAAPQPKPPEPRKIPAFLKPAIDRESPRWKQRKEVGEKPVLHTLIKSKEDFDLTPLSKVKVDVSMPLETSPAKGSSEGAKQVTEPAHISETHHHKKEVDHEAINDVLTSVLSKKQSDNKPITENKPTAETTEGSTSQ